MDEIKQNIAIARACGWTEIENTHTIVLGGVWRGYPPRMQIIGNKERIPDYCGDLNKMAEAEQLFKTTDRIRYNLILESITLDSVDGFTYKTTMASAEKRAEAFLKTLKLWETE